MRDTHGMFQLCALTQHACTLPQTGKVRNMALLISALSGAAYVLSGGPAVAPLRTTALVMNDPQQPRAPRSGWSLSMGGGQRTLADVRRDQRKAAKKYMAEKEGECDIKRVQSGWTTK